MKRLLVDNKKELVVTVSLVAGALLLHALVGVPRQRENREVLLRMRHLDSQIKEASASVGNMVTMLEADSAVADIYERTEEEILPDLLEAIARQGQLHGVQIEAMTPGGVERMLVHGEGPLKVNAEAARLVVTVTARSRYRNLGEYLESLETIPILVAVRDLKIEQPSSGSTMLRSTFKIETYSVRMLDAKAN